MQFTTPPESSNDKTLSGQTTIALREAIIKGHLPPGMKLNEPKLAEQYKVSRGPLREAIRRLEAMRLVTHVPHQGSTVITLNVDAIMELYDIREALEGKAAALAAKNMPRQEIEKLKELMSIHHHYHETNAGKYMHVEGDFDFHYQIIKGSGNKMLTHQLCDELYHLIRMFRYQTSQVKQRLSDALTEHEQLVYAIEQGDESMAEMVMRHHIVKARRSIRALFNTTRK